MVRTSVLADCMNNIVNVRCESVDPSSRLQAERAGKRQAVTSKTASMISPTK